ncbi:hypothetical protein D3C72_1276320 [compost metagenome]
MPTSSESISLPTKRLCFSICFDWAPSSASLPLAPSSANLTWFSALVALSALSRSKAVAGAVKSVVSRLSPASDMSWRFIVMVSVPPTLARKFSGAALVPSRMFSPSKVAFLAKEASDFSSDWNSSL